ncbi:MAG: chemotaxis response regulator protein-glutamate methylesterase [Nitrospinae bacterium]|nr:chemotaxis response regulator protein-glutamate methylesterase [Nitrospinota bacterium]
MTDGNIRVLVVDDSPLVRNILAQSLSMDARIEVVGAAKDAFEAWDLIMQLKPDVVTLDVDMPKMDGVEFLKRLMPQHPVPVIMVSALTREGAKITLEALEYGAVDFVTKPAADMARGLTGMLTELVEKIKAAASVNRASLGQGRARAGGRVERGAKPEGAPATKLIAIGASTGGTDAIRSVLTRIPSNAPAILIVQHMPAGFTKVFAERLNEISTVSVKEAESGELARNGQALVAPGDLQMRIKKTGDGYHVICEPGERVNGHCPSVDVMMLSVAQIAGPGAVGVVLTGMGFDGGEGLLAMRQAGARTIAQDKATSVVYGMPRVAFEKGGVERQAPLDQIPSLIMRMATEAGGKGGAFRRNL